MQEAYVVRAERLLEATLREDGQLKRLVFERVVVFPPDPEYLLTIGKSGMVLVDYPLSPFQIKSYIGSEALKE